MTLRRVVALGLFLVGCRPEATPADAGTTAQDAGGIADAGSVDAGPERNSGFITLSGSASPATTRANATFLPGGPAFTCPETSFGACAYYACARRMPPDGLPAPHAGTIRVTGGTTPLTFTPLADGTYDTVLRQERPWVGGESLVVAADGADVPAFGGTWPAPSTITVTSPAPGDPWTVSRASDVTLSWTGGAGEDVVVTFGTLATSAPTEVECTFAASAGSGVVPAQALGMLPAGDGYYAAVSRTRSVVRAGAWQVTLRAESDAVTGAGAAFYGGATLQ